MSGDRLLIAVVDDEDSVGKALVRFFKAMNIDAKSFPSARDFLGSLKDSHFDCLVLDLQMPDMTGLDLHRYLHMVRPDLKLPTIMMTAHDEPGTRERCFEVGIGAYLHKPVEGSALLAAVQRLVRQRADEAREMDSPVD
jgi:FixJ family two-component response regulator